MTPEEFRQAENLFEQIRGLPEPDRPAALDDACAGNRNLRAQIEGLLEADHAADRISFLARLALEDAAKILSGNTPEPLTPGTVIGNYRVGSCIGAGGMGVVYEAQDVRLNRRVAVKVLPAGFAEESTERIQRFQREARAASGLNHPNIISIFDADFDRGHYFIAMEFVEGKTLRQVIASESRGAAAQTVLDVISQTASALTAAHHAGIVHRDIKPENIMIRPDGFVKVLDFGLAKLLDPPERSGNGPLELPTRPGSVAGTIQYLSPEQVAGQPVSPRSDLFSLGVVAYELATGVRPFDGPTDGAVFDATLNRTPARPSSIRPSLDGDLDAIILRALEKDPDLRFQTASDLRSSCHRLTRDYIVNALVKERSLERPQQSPTSSDVAIASSAAVPSKRSRSRRWRVPAALAVLAALGAAYFWLKRPLPIPRVTGIVQITSDGVPKQYFVNDGTRIYYTAGTEDTGVKVMQISTNGGEPVPMLRLTGMFPLDISPDRSEMLLGQYLKGTSNGPYPIWVSDSLGSAPRRLGDLMADDARWSPKADHIVYSSGSNLGIARSDGSESRTVAKTKGLVQYPAWSRDGRTLRFTLLAKNSRTLWEVGIDGSHLHALLPEWTDHPHEQGVWTPDGKYFIFSTRRSTRDLWVLPESRRLFETAPPSPVRLTSGPLMAIHPKPSPDGRRIYFLGGLNRGELVRYDPKSDQWIPYLGGLAAMQLDYSRDGKWVAYASFPEGSLWRQAIDGSQRIQLTAPPLLVQNPKWSPDGTQIAFMASQPGKPHRVYVVSAGGGAVRQVTNGESGPDGESDPSWSPDGASLVFGPGSLSFDEGDKLALRVVDLKNGRISKLRGSQGLWSPRWSADGRYLAALEFPVFKLCLYNLEAGSRTDLTTIGVGYPAWSRDGRFIYFEDNGTTAWYRLRIKDQKVERIASLSGLKMAIGTLGWVGPSPDGSPISTRDIGSTEIYALDWELP